ncbi:HNH endonuclease [Pandoraea sputorum]|uniref:HNH endonuclease n=1 Tax=Pandoraea sputorum TaxID=93222 RepID=UPI001E511095|nr:HNH endonuclease [Pandoraea sputorum]MCE4059317.1 HNH endonuclease [Pandoraea sputorum]
MKKIFAYHKTHEHGEFWHTYYWTTKGNVQAGDRLYVISGDRPSQPTYFLEGRYEVLSIDPPENNARRLNLRAEALPATKLSISAEPWFDNREFHNRFTSGQSMGSVRQDYIERFDTMLQGLETDEAEEIVGDLAMLHILPLEATERETLALARIGQGLFRSNVIETWGLGDACAVTGIAVRPMLVASHVRPWRRCETVEERLDGANGILLCAHVDRLFDRYLISFNDDGQIVFGPTLSDDGDAMHGLEALGIEPQSTLNLNHMACDAHVRFMAYLEEHRGLLR